MNKEHALKRGYGIAFYPSFDAISAYDACTVEVARIKSLGYKAVVVTTPADKLSRGHPGPTYIVYSCSHYRLQEKMDLNCVRRQSGLDHRIAMKARHENELQEFQTLNQRLQDEFIEFGKDAIRNADLHAKNPGMKKYLGKPDSDLTSD